MMDNQNNSNINNMQEQNSPLANFTEQNNANRYSLVNDHNVETNYNTCQSTTSEETADLKSNCCCQLPTNSNFSLFYWPIHIVNRFWPRHRLENENLLILSTIQVLCAAASIILASVALSRRLFLSQLATGVWAGILMLGTGILGIITARHKRLYTLVSLLVLCVLSCLVSGLLLCHSIAGLVDDSLFYSASYYPFFFSKNPFLQLKEPLPGTIYDRQMSFNTHIGQNQQIRQAPMISIIRAESNLISNLPRNSDNTESISGYRLQLIVVHALMLLVGLLEFSVSLATAVLCSKQVCCGQVHYVSGRTIIMPDTSDLAPSRVRQSGSNINNHNSTPILSISPPMRQFNHTGFVRDQNQTRRSRNNSRRRRDNSAPGSGSNHGASAPLFIPIRNGALSGVTVPPIQSATDSSLLYILPPNPESGEIRTALIFPASPPPYNSEAGPFISHPQNNSTILTNVNISQPPEYRTLERPNTVETRRACD